MLIVPQYVSINQRQYHYDLKEMYTTNMQYHKNDIIKKPLSYWKNCQLDQLITERKIEFSYGMYKYNVVIICPIEKHDVIPQTMKLFPGYKIYLVSDLVTSLTRLAKRNHLQLMRIS